MTTLMSGLRLPLRFLLLLLLCCVSVSSMFISKNHIDGLVACRPHRIQALTQFKDEFDSRGCNETDYFNGVRCDNMTGVVTKIELPSGCLIGTLNPNSSLFRFHHLRYLNLSYNHFTSSSIPSGFGNLNKLEVLSLSSNGFIGQIPSSFSNLTMLSFLDLAENKLTGSVPLIGNNLTKLSVLDLSHNHFSTLEPKSSLFKLHHLRYLSLEFNNFISSFLPSEFGNLNKLEVLYINSNGFFGQVPSSFNNLIMLSKLDLSRNKLTGSFPLVGNLNNLFFLDFSYNHFAGTLNRNSSLFELHHLRYLDLSFNNFSSELHSNIGNLNRLEVLSLSTNGFFGHVPPTISNLTSLTKLYLDTNELTGSFPAVQNLTKLSRLVIADNRFSGTIPSSLFTMPFLSFLDLRENHFSGSIEVSNSSLPYSLERLFLGLNHFEGQIVEPVSKLINLEILDLSFLNTSHLIDSSLFFSLKSLLYLDLSGNIISPTNLDVPMNLGLLVLSRCGISEFPNIFKTLENLEFIDLSNNKINGLIPEWLWSLPLLISVFVANNSFTGFEGSTKIMVNSSVQVLDLSLNRFEGALPDLPLSINVFSAGTNNFTREIPLSICNRSSLVVLDLRYNNFTGAIPPCLSNLKIVNLRHNNLDTSIPDVFYVGSSLDTLDLGYNRLNGKLPRSLLNCSSLRRLSVENNNIEDTFPLWLKALPNLQILFLSSNKFYGPISPPHQGPLGFPELRIFDISDNKFIGSLPLSYFVNWKASSPKMNEDGGLYMVYEKTINGMLRYSYKDSIDLQYKGLTMTQATVVTSYAAIDFSGNRLEGQIPESIGLLKALIALNLSNNAFTGHIPLSLANLGKLESLDLSSNQLSGTIPNGLKTLSFLAFVNVSHNQLKGEIPQGTQITGQPKSSFEGNAGLCGLPLEESCFGTNAPPTQHPKEEEEKEEDNEVLSWKAVVIGYLPGVLLGLAITQVIASYKLEWLVKIIGPTKRINR
ncbi:hypothetical protein AALP_AA8G145500 [Arabis alpina]|uniref:Disease resistance R13L4/SHOC-2-like LRR domain-containing protein n=1 Tax=Arabis alpina TaxID=50452 RepID=A0A087G729_ARAAL|nr:hypothetical protein AALP_AA8G145500 [Arabis alpina]